LNDHPKKVPEWRFNLEAWHLIAICRGLLWASYMAGDGLNDCRRGGVSLSTAHETRRERAARSASNVWIVHKDRTAHGAMMLLSDPHGEIDGGLFYEFRMRAGQLDTAGFSLGGLMLLTHNNSLSWGMTTGAPDVSDCYAVESDPENPLRYQFDGVWKEMKTREVTIPVKDQAARRVKFAYTDHNGVLSPVVARKGTSNLQTRRPNH
jgi:acyl-homoserine lactone acylase PvdQ